MLFKKENNSLNERKFFLKVSLSIRFNIFKLKYKFIYIHKLRFIN